MRLQYLTPETSVLTVQPLNTNVAKGMAVFPRIEATKDRLQKVALLDNCRLNSHNQVDVLVLTPRPSPARVSPVVSRAAGSREGPLRWHGYCRS